MTKLHGGERRRLARIACNVTNRRNGGALFFGGIGHRLCRNGAAELTGDNLHRLPPEEAFTRINV